MIVRLYNSLSAHINLRFLLVFTHKYEQDGRGLPPIPTSYKLLPLASHCPSLTALTFILGVGCITEGPPDSDNVFTWDYALHLLRAAPKTLTSITISMFFLEDIGEDVPPKETTVGCIYWEIWGEVCKRFKGLRHFYFTLKNGDSQRVDILHPFRPDIRSPWLKKFDADYSDCFSLLREYIKRCRQKKRLEMGLSR